MPQNPITPRPGGNQSSLHLTAPAVVKAAPGTVMRVVVQTAATAGNFGVYDTTTVAGAAVGNAIYLATASWPAAGTVITLEFPCFNGIVINPGTGGAVSVSYS